MVDSSSSIGEFARGGKGDEALMGDTSGGDPSAAERSLVSLHGIAEDDPEADGAVVVLSELLFSLTKRASGRLRSCMRRNLATWSMAPGAARE